MNLFDAVSGIPGAMGNALMNLAQEVQGLVDDANLMGEEEIETAGPEEEVEGYVDVEDPGTGATRRKKVRTTRRSTRRTKVKAATPSTSRAASSISARVARIESDLKSLGAAFKAKKVVKTAGAGNRSIFAVTAAATAAGATVATGNVVGNASVYYDRVGYCANVPSLLATLRAAGNQIIDGSDSIAVPDGTAIAPIELAEPVNLAGNSGASFSHTNRGAAAGDCSAYFVPVGHSYGSAAPGAF